MSSWITVRKATMSDLAVIELMQRQAIGAFGRSACRPHQIGQALSTIGVLDRRLVRDQGCFVAEAEGMVIGSGGWSRRRPSYAGSAFGPEGDDGGEARRGGYLHVLAVDPDWARQGVARRLMVTIEARAKAAGCRRLALTAPLDTVGFWRKLGYRNESIVDLAIARSRHLPAVIMAKDMASDDAAGWDVVRSGWQVGRIAGGLTDAVEDDPSVDHRLDDPAFD